MEPDLDINLEILPPSGADNIAISFLNPRTPFREISFSKENTTSKQKKTWIRWMNPSPSLMRPKGIPSSTYLNQKRTKKGQAMATSSKTITSCWTWLTLPMESRATTNITRFKSSRNKDRMSSLLNGEESARQTHNPNTKILTPRLMRLELSKEIQG